MAKWINNFGDLVSDTKNYYVHISNSEEDFITEGDPIEFHTNYKSAKAFAIEQSFNNVATEVRCESFVQDPCYDAPVVLWSERYIKGKKQDRLMWRE